MSVHCTTSHQANARLPQLAGPVLRFYPKAFIKAHYPCPGLLYFFYKFIVFFPFHRFIRLLSNKKKCSEKLISTMVGLQFLGALVLCSLKKEDPRVGVESILCYDINAASIKKSSILCLLGLVL